VRPGSQTRRKLARLTWVIVVLTVAVAGLTAALVVLTLRGTG
jgi:hypothetical protein